MLWLPLDRTFPVTGAVLVAEERLFTPEEEGVLLFARGVTEEDPLAGDELRLELLPDTLLPELRVVPRPPLVTELPELRAGP